ncbi:LON peptidase substrate-binding domain-containing protein [soil metagenome]
MDQDLTALPIFPLNTVLFPGGVLPLRVFETRYMDMIRECMKAEQRFGVCLISAGTEVARKRGESATPQAVGCLAEIRDWDMREMGVLNITTIGRDRFRILDSTTSSGGLIRASAELIDPDLPTPVEDEHAACVQLLARIIAELEERHAQPPDADDEGTRTFPFAEPYTLGDAGWVANRLCEVLPVPLKAKQKLMELEDGRERLAIVDTYLRQKKVL